MSEFRQIGEIAGGTQKPARQHPPISFWKDFLDELDKARTQQAKEEVWERYTREAANPSPAARQRRDSTLEPIQYRPLDRNQRARLIFLCERLDAQTKEKGMHGGCLKRTGLMVLRVLLFHFHNVHTGRCDPSYDTIAKAAGMSRSAVAAALNRLEAAGIITRIRRARWVRRNGRKCCVQWSNAYILDLPKRYRQSEREWYKPPESGSRDQTTAATNKEERRGIGDIENIDPELQRALARLGNAIADREERRSR
jgi:DNA-binding Lrp family transcriptional regulator